MKNFYNKSFYISILFLAFSFIANAQIQWQKSYGGTLYEAANSVVQTMDGGYVVFGVDSSCDGDVVRPCGGSYDLWVVKISSLGVIQWQKSYGGSGDEEAYQIVQTTDKGYAMAAITFSSDVPGFKGASDAWVLKIDSLGAVQWKYAYGGSGLDEATSIAQTADGGYIVGGNSQSTDGDVTGHHGLASPDPSAQDDMWVIKLNSLGIIQWQKSIGGIDDDGSNSIVQTNDLGYAVVGNSKSLDGDLLGKGNKGYNDWMVVKLSPTGSITWLKLFGGTSQDDAANSIAKTADGGYVVAGATGSLDGDVTGNHGAPCTAAECTDNDCWVVKIDSLGVLQWEKAFGGTGNDNTFSISQTTDGGYAFAGYSTSNDGDITGNHGLYDFWVAKLSATGTLSWQQSFGGTGIDQPFSMKQTTDGGYIVAGVSESNDMNVSGNHGNTDFWVLKLSSATGITEWSKENAEVFISPNPFNDITNITFKNIPENKTNLSFVIYDVVGKQIKKISSINKNGLKLERGNLVSGMYFYQLTDSDKILSSGKLIVQ